jgi:hypothetical protein
MMKTKSGVEEGRGGGSPSQLIDARVLELNDWRGEMLARIRMLIKQADPEVVEEVKWRKPSNSMLGVPVWSHVGIICTGETHLMPYGMLLKLCYTGLVAYYWVTTDCPLLFKPFAIIDAVMFVLFLLAYRQGEVPARGEALQ